MPRTARTSAAVALAAGTIVALLGCATTFAPDGRPRAATSSENKTAHKSTITSHTTTVDSPATSEPATTTTVNVSGATPAAPSTHVQPVSDITLVAEWELSALSDTYEFGERSFRVEALQKVLRVMQDGIYGPQTRKAHLAALEERHLDTTNVPHLPPAPEATTVASSTSPDVEQGVSDVEKNPPTTSAQVAVTTPESTGPGKAAGPDAVWFSNVCTNEQAATFLHTLLDPYDIPIPDFETGTVSRSAYITGQALIRLEPCASLSAVAHEAGHYVMDVANNFDWGRHAAEAAAHFTGEHWIRGKELVPGIEYSAHCVGKQWWRTSTYTKCPNETMAAYAQSVIDRAQTSADPSGRGR